MSLHVPESRMSQEAPVTCYVTSTEADEYLSVDYNESYTINSSEKPIYQKHGVMYGDNSFQENALCENRIMLKSDEAIQLQLVSSIGYLTTLY